MSDSFTKKIIEEAERIKNTDKLLNEKPLEEQNEIKNVVKSDLDSFAVWFKIMFASNRLILATLFILITFSISAIILMASIDDSKVVLTMELISILFIALIVFGTVHFLRTRAWRKSLNFQLNGWENLVHVQPLKKSEWRNVKISLELETTDSTKLIVYESAIEILRFKVQKRFYSTDFMDARQDWKLHDKYSLTGSANTAVTYEIYQWCTKVLSPIQKEIGGLNEVRIYVHGKSFNVSTPTVD